MQLSCVDVQAQTMVEAVQNHTPSCLIIDEIGRHSEVQAALTCKERGVRIIASAHGDLTGLVRNPALSGLVGGVESVIVSDRVAKRHFDGSKFQPQRKGPPIFDVIIELEKGNLHEWKVVAPCSAAVDSILSTIDGRYQAETRTRLHSGASPDSIHTITVLGKKDGEPFLEAEETDEEEEYCDSDDESSTTCPSCQKEFVHRAAMLDHALHKAACKAKLSNSVKSSFEREFCG